MHLKIFLPRIRVLLCSTGALLVACSDQHDASRSSPSESDGTALGGSPSAQRSQEAALREDLAAPRHVSDGGGSASLEKIRSSD